MKKNYNIGLNINNNAIGFAVMDDDFNLISKQGKTLIGAHKFDEAMTKKDRRLLRDNRRTTSRKEERIKWLNDIFAPYLEKEDPSFLKKIQQSGLIKKDKDLDAQGPLYSKKFYQNYPTLFHLRKALIEQKRKFSVIEIYAAIHHIIKYRGNHLYDLPTDKFNTAKLDIRGKLDILLSLLSTNKICDCSNVNLDELTTMLKDTGLNVTAKRKKINELLIDSNDDGDAKAKKKVVTNALIGAKANFKKLFNISSDGTISFSLDSDTIDDNIDELKSKLSDDLHPILESFISLWDDIKLNQILPNGELISDKMVKLYEQHREDLLLLKKVIHNDKVDSAVRATLSQAYSDYLANKKSGNYDVRDSFYNALKKALKSVHLAESDEILARIKEKNFMPKLKTRDNVVIPYQAHQLELDKIIDNQARYYPWLKSNQEKLDLLVSFTIPYYVGPLTTKENSPYAWMVRKESGKIYPWNFNQKVDLVKTSEAFIDRLRSKDTYLYSEPVLPKTSIVYQTFCVLNELNNLKINGRALNRFLKEKAFEYIKEHGNITKNALTKLYQKVQKVVNKPYISGFSDGQKLSSNYNSYRKLKDIFGSRLDDPKFINQVDNLILYASVFEDKDILIEKIKQNEPWISDDELTRFIKLYQTGLFNGWGNISHKLLIELKDDNGNSIIDLLWKTSNNFQKIISKKCFAEKIQEIQKKVISTRTLDDTLEAASASQPVRKTIRQALNIIDEIKKIMGTDPETIAVMNYRSRGLLNYAAKHFYALKRFYADHQDELEQINPGITALYDNVLEEKTEINNAIYLYFAQAGLDLYSGKKLNFKDLKLYTIDHIISDEIFKNESLDNLVITESPLNTTSKINVPVFVLGNKQNQAINGTNRLLWDILHEYGLMTNAKYQNLITDPDNVQPYQISNAIYSQLIQQSQSVKLLANILNVKFQNVKVIGIRQSLINRLRDDNNMIRNELVNDYHFGMDAYLCTFLGKFLIMRYPKLQSYFVYGEYVKANIYDKTKKLAHLNFLHDFEDNNITEIVEPYSNEVIGNREKLLEKLTRAYHFKFMLITQARTISHGQFYGQTIFPANYHSSVKRKLIPTKKNRDVKYYGGYSAEVQAYSALVKVTTNRDSYFKLVRIPLRFKSNLEKLKKHNGHKEYKEALNKIVYEELLKSERNNFKIVNDHVLNDQLIYDSGKKFYAHRSNYCMNGEQLILTSKSLMTLNKLDPSNEELIEVYEDILEQVNKRFALYDINKFRERLNNGLQKFEDLSLDKSDKNNKRAVLNRILIGLHCNNQLGDLKCIGMKTPLGSMQAVHGIKLSNQAVFINQSVTGFWSKKVPVTSMTFN